MKKHEIEIQRVDPAGNITIFVWTPIERKYYQTIARQLLDREDLAAEQVGFLREDGGMNMCGLEFCGNATRSFALIKAIRDGFCGKADVSANVSGTDAPMKVSIDTETCYTKIQMPDPVRVIRIKDFPLEEINGSVLVDLEGIGHLILHGVEATRETFDRIRDAIDQVYDFPAFGVMFMADDDASMIPVVYVRDVDSTYFEGSCCSGSTAAAIALSEGLSDGTHSFNLVQPAGTLTASAEIKDGRLAAVYIEGPVSYDPSFITEVEY